MVALVMYLLTLTAQSLASIFPPGISEAISDSPIPRLIVFDFDTARKFVDLTPNAIEEARKLMEDCGATDDNEVHLITSGDFLVLKPLYGVLGVKYSWANGRCKGLGKGEQITDQIVPNSHKIRAGLEEKLGVEGVTITSQTNGLNVIYNYNLAPCNNKSLKEQDVKKAIQEVASSTDDDFAFVEDKDNGVKMKYTGFTKQRFVESLLKKNQTFRSLYLFSFRESKEGIDHVSTVGFGGRSFGVFTLTKPGSGGASSSNPKKK